MGPDTFPLAHVFYSPYLYWMFFFAYVDDLWDPWCFTLQLTPRFAFLQRCPPGILQVSSRNGYFLQNRHMNSDDFHHGNSWDWVRCSAQKIPKSPWLMGLSPVRPKLGLALSQPRASAKGDHPQPHRRTPGGLGDVELAEGQPMNCCVYIYIYYYICICILYIMYNIYIYIYIFIKYVYNICIYSIDCCWIFYVCLYIYIYRIHWCFVLLVRWYSLNIILVNWWNYCWLIFHWLLVIWFSKC